MPTKKNYSRYFVILQEEEKGYSLAGDKLPSGYAKFEIKNDKCKISYYVQNLKKELGPYYMILICSKRDVNKLIKLGEMNIDDYGRTEVSFEYGVDNIAETGIGIDKIAGAAILKLSDSNILPVMTGFTSTEAPEGWRNFDMVEKKAEEQEIINETPSQEEPEVEVQEKDQLEEQTETEKKVEENIEPVIVSPELTENKNEVNNIFDDYEETIENVKNEESSKEDVQEQPVEEQPVEIQPEVIQQEEEQPEVMQPEERQLEETQPQIEQTEDKERIIQEQPEQSRNKKHSNEEEFPVGPEGEFFRSITDEFQQEDRISDEIKRCKWYKVPVKNKKSLEQVSDYNKYTIAYYPMYSYYQYIRKYGYYLLGYKCDFEGKLKYIVYAIPGTKSFEDQPFTGRSGFVTWIPVKDGEEAEDSAGYWLMFYDFKNKTIVIPVKA